MKKLFVLLATGVLLTAPAFAQKITVTTDQKAGPAKAGDKVMVCASEDAAVMNVAAFQLTFTFPAGWSVPLSDPKDPSSATFTSGPAAKSASLNIPNYDAPNNQLIVGLVGTKNVSGPGQIGCFELDASATAQSGNLGMSGSLNDKDSNTVAFSAMGTTLQGVAGAGTAGTATAGTATAGTATAGTATAGTATAGTATAGTATAGTATAGTATAGTATAGTATAGTATAGTATAGTATAGTATAGTATAGTATAGTATAGTATAGPTTGTGGCPDVKHVAGQIDISDVSGTPGQTVTVSINVDSKLIGLASFGLTVNYDPKVLTFKSSDPADDSADFTLGPVGTGALLAVNGHATPGQISIALANSKNSKVGGLLLSFPLTIMANAPSPTKSAITLSAVSVVDKDSNTINATVGNGVVTLGICGATTGGTATAGTATAGTATAGTATAGTATAGTATAGTATAGTATAGTATAGTATAGTATAGTATAGTATAGTATAGPGTACPDTSHVAGQIDISDISAKPGDKVTVNINVDPKLIGLASFGLTVNYDPKVLSFKSSDATDDSADFMLGPVGTGALLAVNGHATPGQISIALANSKNSKAGGLLLSFPLTVLTTAANPTKSAITLSAVSVVDKDSNTINATVGNGVVTVGTCGATTGGTATAGTATAGTATAGPTATTGAGAANSGDINGDGKVDISDVKAAINILFGIDTDPNHIKAADVQKTGGPIDLIDIRIILQMAVKNG